MISFSKYTWEVYVGLPQDEVVKLLKNQLDSKNIDYKIAKAPPNFMYDQENEQILIETKDLVLSFIYVTADPLTRLFSTIIGTKAHSRGITLLSIKYKKQSKKLLKTILTNFVRQCPKEPWKIRNHPRFQFAMLLELINKRKWKAFILNEI